MFTKYHIDRAKILIWNIGARSNSPQFCPKETKNFEQHTTNFIFISILTSTIFNWKYSKFNLKLNNSKAETVFRRTWGQDNLLMNLSDL